MKRVALPLISTLLILAAVFLLSSCNNCEHQWEEATCTTPKTCQFCNLTEGMATGHQFVDATCTMPKTCQICETTKGSAKGHTKGDWILVKKATLIDRGKEMLLCSICDETIDSRTTDKKLPEVEYDYFNFTDGELIDWINEISTVQVGYTELGVFDKQSTNTSYKISFSDKTGALLLNHGDNGVNGNVCAIMVYFDYWADAASLAIYIGNHIDSNFSSDDAILKVAYNKSYTRADMTVVRLDLDTDFEVSLLAPSEFIAEMLS